MANPQKMTMVVARYNGNLDWLKEIQCDYIVFNKGDDLPEWVKNEIKLPNIGRDAHIYLTYIIDNYDNLPDYSIFVHGYPFDTSPELIKKINDFDAKVDFFPLSPLVTKILSAEEYGRRSYFWFLNFIESVRKIYSYDLESFEFPKGSQFIVSKKAILFHTKMTYQKIMDFMLAGDPDNKYSPFNPWMMERLWGVLFDGKHKTKYDEN